MAPKPSAKAALEPTQSSTTGKSPRASKAREAAAALLASKKQELNAAKKALQAEDEAWSAQMSITGHYPRLRSEDSATSSIHQELQASSDVSLPPTRENTPTTPKAPHGSTKAYNRHDLVSLYSAWTALRSARDLVETNVKSKEAFFSVFPATVALAADCMSTAGLEGLDAVGLLAQAGDAISGEDGEAVEKGFVCSLLAAYLLFKRMEGGRNELYD